MGGTLTVKSDTVGEVTVDLSKVKTFSTAQPVQLHVVAIRDLTKIHPPPVPWTGSVTGAGTLTRGHSAVDWRAVTTGQLFDSFEWLLAISGAFDDYLVNVDARARIDLMRSLFTELKKKDPRYDAAPAPGPGQGRLALPRGPGLERLKPAAGRVARGRRHDGAREPGGSDRGRSAPTARWARIGYDRGAARGGPAVHRPPRMRRPCPGD